LQYFTIDELADLFSKFEIINLGGEPFSQKVYDTLKNNNFKGLMLNFYGPTEITIACNARVVNDGILSVGKEFFNVYEEVMDLDSNPLPNNIIGELYVAGYGVSRGYLNRPEKNKESYVTINGVRYFRTGDLAMRDDEGKYFIHGRIDNQIKLRGLRIEIGEIESLINKFEGIKSVAVSVKKIKGNEHLCSYFTVEEDYKKDNLAENEYSIDISSLKEYLSQKLTYYMVPTVYMELDKLPETLNGKTDMKNLPVPVLISDYVAPRNNVEAFFTEIFENIFGLDKVGITDNFFEIGGTSLLVTKITLE